MPAVDVDETWLQLGPVTLDQSDSVLITIANTGTAPLLISNVQAVEGGTPVGPEESLISFLAEAPFEIPADGEKEVVVSCSISEELYWGSTAVELHLDSNDPHTPQVTLDVSCTLSFDADGDGHEDARVGGDDCDDADPSTNPTAADVWYDGQDHNCDGRNDYDQDGDGYIADFISADPEVGGGDCDDTDASVHPAAQDDDPEDGIDQDCDASTP